MNIKVIELQHAATLLAMAARERLDAEKHENLSGDFHVQQAEQHRGHAAACEFAVRRLLSEPEGR